MNDKMIIEYEGENSCAAFMVHANNKSMEHLWTNGSHIFQQRADSPKRQMTRVGPS